MCNTVYTFFSIGFFVKKSLSENHKNFDSKLSGKCEINENFKNKAAILFTEIIESQNQENLGHVQYMLNELCSENFFENELIIQKLSKQLIFTGNGLLTFNSDNNSHDTFSILSSWVQLKNDPPLLLKKTVNEKIFLICIFNTLLNNFVIYDDFFVQFDKNQDQFNLFPSFQSRTSKYYLKVKFSNELFFLKKLFKNENDIFRKISMSLDKIYKTNPIDLIHKKNLIINKDAENKLLQAWSDFVLNNKNLFSDILDLKTKSIVEISGNRNANYTLRIFNPLIFPLILKRIEWIDGEWKFPIVKLVSSRAENDFDFIESVENINLPKNAEGRSLLLVLNIVGSDEEIKLPIKRAILKKNENKNDIIRLTDTTQNFSFLLKDVYSKKIIVKQGDWTISNPLVIPEDYIFVIHGNVKLHLTKNGNIISYGPLDIEGNSKNPILISSDGTCGVFVQRTKNKLSSISYAVFDGLNRPKENEWEITGALTFYEAPVKITNSIIKNSHSEDALHIMRTTFELNSIALLNSFSDSLDSDYSSGKIEGAMFEKSGNDALDLSGSNVNLKDIIIYNAGDKGVSIGEVSTAKIEDVHVYDSKFGFASKDNSNVEIFNSSINRTIAGLMVYMKKFEYGYSKMNIKNIKFFEVIYPALTDKNSTLLGYEGKTHLLGIRKETVVGQKKKDIDLSIKLSFGKEIALDELDSKQLKKSVMVEGKRSSIKSGSAFQIEYDFGAQLISSKSWVGLFSVSGSFYNYFLKQFFTDSIPKGSMKIVIPNELPPGMYVFRVFVNGKWDQVGASNPFFVY